MWQGQYCLWIAWSLGVSAFLYKSSSIWSKTWTDNASVSWLFLISCKDSVEDVVYSAFISSDTPFIIWGRISSDFGKGTWTMVSLMLIEGCVFRLSLLSLSVHLFSAGVDPSCSNPSKLMCLRKRKFQQVPNSNLNQDFLLWYRRG